MRMNAAFECQAAADSGGRNLRLLFCQPTASIDGIWHAVKPFAVIAFSRPA